MRYWLPLIYEAPEQFTEVAVMAEALGWAGIAVADHLVVPDRFTSVHPSGDEMVMPSSAFPDPFTSVAAMAAVTTRLRFMSYVYILPMRDPFSVAKQVGTASVLSGGRVVLGVGAGWLREEFEALGQDFTTRGRRMDEMVVVLRDFWEDGWAEHHGEFFDFPRCSMLPAPAAPVPVWVGGKSDAALRRAIRNDGWLGMNYGLEEIDALLARLATLRAEAGDARPGFEVFVIPNAMPSPELYASLEAKGVTSTLGGAWAPGDPAFASLEAKRAAMEGFAKLFL
ncbi:MAG TPA: TIGR03619 family F420-dependent LLM class oxidoreductase [Acidimicrobiales bacterium]|nr:TIGR03619 family F420-dependent LLM class oxidoreductase [Acidimicrobiales bacterium]